MQKEELYQKLAGNKNPQYNLRGFLTESLSNFFFASPFHHQILMPKMKEKAPILLM